MIKPVLKTLSLSFLMLGGVSVAAAREQSPLLHLSLTSADSVRYGCSSAVEIERGWEAQQQLLDERIASRTSAVVEIPGTIISPPLPDFAQNRAHAVAVKADPKPDRASNSNSGSARSDRM